MSHTTVPITAGSGTPIAVDLVSSANIQRFKPAWGVEGAAVDASATDPLPVAVVTSAVGSTVVAEDGSIPGGSTNVTSVVAMDYTYDVAAGNWTREGAATFFSYDLDETEEDIKTSAGTLYGYAFSNLHSSDKRYVRFYDATAASTTVGSTAALFPLMLPPAASGHVWFGSKGPKFATALCAAATTATGATSTGAPGTNEVILTVWYK